ncbi:MAG TPA: SseB family protein [Microbacterium sp.]|uniref:SseB family protein n=1 Tax=Microbacterium sp. TaxID=51671 RepID=UPI002CA2A9D6|nr:SseB family protein [Microbacterium sp.]HWI30648.1 SseB family protein [Microbacterium sp.]
MALFSRRKKPGAAVTPDAVPETPPAPSTAPADAEPTARAASEPPAAPDAAPAVSISVSSFRGLGAPTPTPTPTPTPAPAPPAPRPLAPAEAPAVTESVPGLRDNVLLAEALEAYGALPEPTSTDLLNVTRQLLQGHVFLRVQGDARALLSEGKELPLAVVRNGEKEFLLAFSTGAALQASVRAVQDPQTSAMGQPVGNVIRHLLAASHDGLILDQSSAPARAVIPRELLERVLKEGDPAFTVKNLLSQPRTPATPGAIAAALVTAPLWVAVGQAPPDTPEGKPRVGIAESQTPDGKRYLEVFSHPLEVLALGRGNQAMPFPVAKLATSLRGHAELTGIVVDPGGPWIRLERDALGPVLALADAG